MDRKLPRSVLVLGPHPYGRVFTGPAIYIEDLARSLSNSMRVTVVSQTRYGKQKQVTTGDGVKVIFTPDWEPPGLPILLKACMVGGRYDLIHINTARSFFIKYIRKKPLVMSVHGYVALEGVANGKFKPNSIRFNVYRWIEKKAVEKADAVIAVGKTLREWIINELGADPNKVFHIPNGVDIKRFKSLPSAAEELRKKLGISNDKKVVLYSKALTNQNGILDLLGAMAAVSKRYPNVVLLILGDGPLKEKIIEFKDRRLPNHIIYGGRVPHSQMPAYMSMSDAFVLPSRMLRYGQYELGEVCPVSLREAMSCELPVVATAVGGNKEMLEGENDCIGKAIGILVPPENEKAMVDAMVYLLEHPNKAKEIGKRAREHIISGYAISNVSEKVLDVYSSVVKN